MNFRDESFKNRVLFTGLFVVKNFSTLVILVFSVLGLKELWKTNLSDLHKDEKKFLFFILLIFLSGLVSQLLSGYEARAVSVAVNVQLLLAIPTYLVIKKYNFNYVYFLQSLVVISFFYGFVIVLDLVKGGGFDRVGGSYGETTFGFMALIVTLLQINRIIAEKEGGLALYASVFVAVLALLLSGSRGPLLYLFISLFFLILFTRQYSSKIIKSFLLPIIIIIVAVSSYQESFVRKRFDLIQSDIIGYLNSNVDSELRNTSIGLRFESWKGAFNIFLEHPVIGIGVGSYSEGIKQQIELGVLNKNTQRIGHAHNDYLQYAAERGVFGVLSLIFLQAFLLRFYLKNYSSKDVDIRKCAQIGILIFIPFWLQGLTSSPFIHNGLQGMFLILNSVLIINILKNQSKYENTNY